MMWPLGLVLLYPEMSTHLPKVNLSAQCSQEIWFILMSYENKQFTTGFEDWGKSNILLTCAIDLI